MQDLKASRHHSADCLPRLRAQAPTQPARVARKLLEQRAAASALLLSIASESSDIARDVLIVHTGNAWLHGQPFAAGLAATGAAALLPQCLNSAQRRARRQWFDQSWQAARQVMVGNLDSGEGEDDDLRATLKRTISLTTQAAEGTCGLLSQCCVLGASPVGQGIGVCLLAVAMVMVGVNVHAQKALSSAAAAVGDEDACVVACEQTWQEDEEGEAARVECLAACTKRMATMADAVQQHQATRHITRFTKLALGTLPALFFLHASRAQGIPLDASVLPPVFDAFDEGHTLLNLAVWLPLAAHQFSICYRLFADLRLRP